MTQIVPAGREDCCCSSPYNQILEQLTTMQAGITAANTTAGTALATASQEAGNAAASALAAANSASAAAQDASDALAQATAAASSASSAASSLTSIQNTITTTLNTYLAAKVDKLTTSGDFAYTHSTGTQGETAIVDGTTSNSLPIRDGNGRIQAADPASGATDRTLVTANWVSQTGDAGPNNVVHKSGNETISGVKTFNGTILSNGIFNNKATQNIESSSTWRRLYYNTTSTTNQFMILLITPQKPVLSPDEYGILMVGGTAGTLLCKWIVKGSAIIDGNYVLTYSTGTGFELWVKNYNGNRGLCAIRLNETSWGSISNNWASDTATVNASFDPSTYDAYQASS